MLCSLSPPVIQVMASGDRLLWTAGSRGRFFPRQLGPLYSKQSTEYLLIICQARQALLLPVRQGSSPHGRSMARSAWGFDFETYVVRRGMKS